MGNKLTITITIDDEGKKTYSTKGKRKYKKSGKYKKKNIGFDYSSLGRRMNR